MIMSEAAIRFVIMWQPRNPEHQRSLIEDDWSDDDLTYIVQQQASAGPFVVRRKQLNQQTGTVLMQTSAACDFARHRDCGVEALLEMAEDVRSDLRSTAQRRLSTLDVCDILGD